MRKKTWMAGLCLAAALFLAPPQPAAAVSAETAVCGEAVCGICGRGAAEVYTAPSGKERAVLHLHGGGYTAGLNDFYRGLADDYAALAEAKRVYTPDYRTAPEHVYPAALDDAERVYEEMLRRGEKPGNVIVIGDSAGGNLALALALRLKEEGKPQPAALVLISPWTAMDSGGPSRRYNAERDATLAALPDMQAEVARPSYAAGRDRRDPRLSPAYADLSGLPPMLIQTGSRDMLLSDSLTLAAEASEDGAAVTLSVYPEMPHDFPIVTDGEKAEEAREEIRDFLRRKLGT